MTPDILINVYFLKSCEGGRKTAIEGIFYSCPLFIDKDAFDCRLLLNGSRLEPGQKYTVGVKFLFLDYVKQRLAVGKEVTLWEGKTVAKGQIVAIMYE